MSEVSIEEAESVAGRRLDRRKNYAVIDGEVCETARWTQACSGCYEGPNLMTDTGMGCDECGHTGKRRNEMWVPLYAASD